MSVHLLSHCLEETTLKAYASHLRRFFQFCSEINITPTDASVYDIVKYVAWHGERGSVHADSLQPYFSAINKYLAHAGKEPVAMGPLVHDAVTGLRALQADSAQVDERNRFPAQTARDIFDAAEKLSHTCCSAEQLQLLRSLLATATAFIYYHRSDTDHGLLDEDLIVDTGFIMLRERSAKGKKRNKTRRVIMIPENAIPGFAQLILRYKQLRAQLAPVAGDQLWSVDRRKTRATDQTAWLKQACDHVGAHPPAGYKWTSHSLRKGAASSAYAINVTLTKIRYFGGWSHTSSAVHAYIDPATLPDAACIFFFGWCLTSADPPAIPDGT